MAERAAIVTGASSGIGLAVSRMLGQEGHAVTMAARRPDKLEAACEELRSEGLEVQPVAGNLVAENAISVVVDAHRDRYGRLDVLVNNAGIGAGEAVGELTTKKVDLQLDLNLRSTILFYRECTELLREAGAEHRNALVVNTSSVAGKQGEAWLSVYSATKFGVVGFTQAMNRELREAGVKSTALCPAFVDTPMTDFVKQHVPAEEMIRAEDIAEGVRLLLRLSPACLIPELLFTRPSGDLAVG